MKFKRNLLFPILLCLFCSFSRIPVKAQTFDEPIGQCFHKSNRKAIEKRMNQLKIRVGKEMNCSVDSISYVIDKKYIFSYTKECRHLPKIITFYACGQNKTYEQLGLTGLAGYWLLASWTEKK